MPHDLEQTLLVQIENDLVEQMRHMLHSIVVPWEGGRVLGVRELVCEPLEGAVPHPALVVEQRRVPHKDKVLLRDLLVGCFCVYQIVDRLV